MIRYLYICILFLGITTGVSAQVFLTEEFTSGLMPPAGWSIERQASSWSTTFAAAAVGFSLPEACFSKVEPSVIDTTRLISPVIDLTGIDSVKLHFWIGFVRNGAGTPYIGVATRSAGGPWDSVWALRPTSGLSHFEFSHWIKNSDVGSGQFQFCLYVQGNLNCLTYYHVDDIILSYPVRIDGSMLSLGNTPSYTIGPFAVDGYIENTGIQTIQSAEIHWSLNDGPVHSTQFAGFQLLPYEKMQFVCTDSAFPEPGKNHLSVWIEKINGNYDLNPDNDTLHLLVQNVVNPVRRYPLFEDFASSSCSYCPHYEYELDQWCIQLGDSASVIKYQMNFPGNGDPYYTYEGGIRKDYYDVNSVPSIFCDGAEKANGLLSYLQNAFHADVAKLGMMELRGVHELHGDSVMVQATILPLADFPKLKLYGAVIEKRTTGNAGSSGQTEFNNVMMKMIPGARGEYISLACDQPFQGTYTASLAGTHIEEMTDLRVVLWVEDTVTKTVLQSCYSAEGTIPSAEARLIRILVDSVDVSGFNPDLFAYSVAIPDPGSRIPEVIGIPMDTNATVVVTPPTLLPGTALLDVTAQDNIAHNQYSVNLIVTGMDETPGRNIAIFPNPAADRLYIHGAEHARITLWSVAGTCLLMEDDFTGSVLPLQSVPRGVCVLKIERSDGRTVYVKVVVR